ncbi:MAG: glycoside hydrolase family 31 protein, partial [Spirochaetaceae bacterium]
MNAIQRSQAVREVQPDVELDLNKPFRSRLVSVDGVRPGHDGRSVVVSGLRAPRFDRANSTGLDGIFGTGHARLEDQAERAPYALRIALLQSNLLRITLDTRATPEADAQTHAPAPVVTEEELAAAGLVGMPATIDDRDGEVVLRHGPTAVSFSRSGLTWSVERDGSPVVAETTAASSIYWGYFSFPSGTIERDGRPYTTTSILRRRDEDFYGLGEQFTDLNKRRQRVELYNRDPANTLANRTYITVPFFISTGGYGVLVNSHAALTVDLGSTTNQAVGIEMEGEVLDFYVLLGSPAEVLSLYHRMTGPAAVPPLWSFGLWLSTIRRYRSDTALMEVADEVRRRGFPCDVLHVDPPWMGTDLTCTLAWGPDFVRKDAMIAHLRRLHLRLCLWISPYVPVGSALHAEGLAEGFFVRDTEGSVIVNRGPMNFWSVPFVYIDFTRPAEADWIREHYRRLHRDGVAVLKVDLGELGPDEAVYANGLAGRDGHNYYTLAYQRTVFEAANDSDGQPALIWCRSGGAGSQRYPVHWAGDVACDYENMAGQLRAILSAGLSGFVFFSHDIGGFVGRPTPELYARWFQFAMFTSHTRAHGGEPHEPWEYGEEVEAICRRFAALRYSLLPEIYDASHKAAVRGTPLVKALVLDYPDDPNVRSTDDQYLFCDKFLVAPMFSDRGERRVYLPAGVWWEFSSAARVESRGEWLTVHCELDELPVWVRDGSAVLRCNPGPYTDADAMTASLSVQLYGEPSGTE